MSAPCGAELLHLFSVDCLVPCRLQASQHHLPHFWQGVWEVGCRRPGVLRSLHLARALSCASIWKSCLLLQT